MLLVHQDGTLNSHFAFLIWSRPRAALAELSPRPVFLWTLRALEYGLVGAFRMPAGPSCSAAGSFCAHLIVHDCIGASTGMSFGIELVVPAGAPRHEALPPHV
mmetsp:Transcript_23153/g.56308  ORF Transcript_23153/g.56308 Transcript_23153/m.56308 type:complete len:103 (+) Transcript_23153:157-465(+)